MFCGKMALRVSRLDVRNIDLPALFDNQYDITYNPDFDTCKS
jgi:hypothetical protein